MRSVEKKLKITEVVLRCLIFGMGMLAAALVVSDTQVLQIMGIEKKAEFTDMKALVFLVVADVIAAVYSLLQCIRCVTNMVRGGNIFSKPLAWVIFFGDQLLAYLTFTAVVAAAESAVLGQFGQTEFGWMGIANLFGKFCNQIGEGVVSSLVASLSMVALSCISAFNLFRLYGGSNKVENNGS